MQKKNEKNQIWENIADHIAQDQFAEYAWAKIDLSAPLHHKDYCRLIIQ